MVRWYSWARIQAGAEAGMGGDRAQARARNVERSWLAPGVGHLGHRPHQW
jgi:hypothetical protein